MRTTSRLQIFAATLGFASALTLGCFTAPGCSGGSSAPQAACDDDYASARYEEYLSICALAQHPARQPLVAAPAGLATREPTSAIRIRNPKNSERFVAGHTPFHSLEGSPQRTFSEDFWTDSVNSELPGWSAGAVHWALELHPDVKARDVVAILALLREHGALEGALHFVALVPEGPSPRDPELYKKFVDNFGRAKAAIRSGEPGALERISEERAALYEFNKDCEAIQWVHNMLTASPTPWCETLASGYAMALRHCGCPDWEPKLQTSLYVDMFDEPPLGKVVAVPVHIDANAIVEDPGPEVTWGDLIAQATQRDVWQVLSLRLQR